MLLLRWTHVGCRSEDRQSDLADADGAEGIHGGAIWRSTPAVDPKRGMVYVTTGNNYATPREVAECQEGGKRDCLPIDDHIDSFVPLDRKTGAIKWAN